MAAFHVVNGIATRAYPLGSFLHVAEAAGIEGTFAWKQTPFELGKCTVEDWGPARRGRLPHTDVDYIVFRLSDGRCAGIAGNEQSAPVFDSAQSVANYLSGSGDPDSGSPAPI